MSLKSVKLVNNTETDYLYTYKGDDIEPTELLSIVVREHKLNKRPIHNHIWFICEKKDAYEIMKKIKSGVSIQLVC